GGQFHTHGTSSFVVALSGTTGANRPVPSLPLQLSFPTYFTIFTSVPFGSRGRIWNSSMNAWINSRPRPECRSRFSFANGSGNELRSNPSPSSPITILNFSGERDTVRWTFFRAL